MTLHGAIVRNALAPDRFRALETIARSTIAVNQEQTSQMTLRLLFGNAKILHLHSSQNRGQAHQTQWCRPSRSRGARTMKTRRLVETGVACLVLVATLAYGLVRPVSVQAEDGAWVGEYYNNRWLGAGG
jgi:hypothetical protein